MFVRTFKDTELRVLFQYLIFLSTTDFGDEPLFYVAFFGGIIPLVALGVKNAKWLRVKKQMISMIIVVGVFLLLLKAVVTALVMGGSVVGFNLRFLRWGFRGVALLFYLGYRFLLRRQYHQHLVTVGEFEPMLRDAMIWIAAAIVIETVFLLLGMGIVNVFK